MWLLQNVNCNIKKYGLLTMIKWLSSFLSKIMVSFIILISVYFHFVIKAEKKMPNQKQFTHLLTLQVAASFIICTLFMLFTFHWLIWILYTVVSILMNYKTNLKINLILYFKEKDLSFPPSFFYHNI